MITGSKRLLTLALMAAPLCFFGCGSSNSTNSSATGGATSTGGKSGGGGATVSGGSTSSGGSSRSGGATATGGSATGGTTGSTSCTIDSSTVTAAIYPNGLTLTKACSPYMVDEISIDDGGVLTIEAGVTLKFSPNTTIFVGQSGSGKLLAKGTAQDPITLTSQSGLSTDEGWYGLEFFEGSSGSQVTYTTIEYAGGNLDAAIVGESGMPKHAVTLDHVAIKNLIDSSSAGIQVLDSTSSFVVTACTLDGAPYTP